jgi:hypothetical protein
MLTENFCNFAGWLNPPFEDLSRMMGNYQVRFLGDKGGVIRLRYPTKTETFEYYEENIKKWLIS